MKRSDYNRGRDEGRDIERRFWLWRVKTLMEGKPGYAPALAELMNEIMRDLTDQGRLRLPLVQAPAAPEVPTPEAIQTDLRS